MPHSFPRVKSGFVILLPSWGGDGGDRGAPDLLTGSQIPNFLRKTVALSVLHRLHIEPGCPCLRQWDPKDPHTTCQSDQQRWRLFSSSRDRSGSLPAISYQTCRITEAAQVSAAIIHPYCIDPVGLVRMQHTFQGNFFSSSVFVLSWFFLELLLGVVYLLEKVPAGQCRLWTPV